MPAAHLILGLSLGLMASSPVAAQDAARVEKPKVAGDLPLAFQADFESDDLSAWDFTDPKAWRLSDAGGTKSLEQHKQSEYKTQVRSPFNIAWAKGVDVADFVLDARVQSTAREYGHRDLCFFFGKQDPSHFYYVHLATAADPHAHSVFVVDGKDRVSICEDRTKGVQWTEGWHHVRIVRKVKDGLIQVFFDDMDKPIMTAKDTTFDHGAVGVGSFDDTGRFDVIRVWGAKP